MDRTKVHTSYISLPSHYATMISSPEQEDFVVRWLLAEIIHLRNKGRPTLRSEASHWVSHTRVHKIEASTFEKFQIPVTRSWYKFGTFVHCNALDNPRFLFFRNDYSRHPERALGLRKGAVSLGIPVEDILAFLQERLPEISGRSPRDFLVHYYEREAPSKYKNLYVSKQKLSNLFEDMVNQARTLSRARFVAQIEQASEYLSEFSEATIGSFDDERLSDSNARFMDIVETAFDKIELLVKKGSKQALKVSFFREAKKAFDDFVWNPFACEISQRTVTGLRATDERGKMRQIEEIILKKVPAQFQKLEENRENSRLSLSWAELQEFKEEAFRDERTARTLSNLVGIYGRAKDD